MVSHERQRPSREVKIFTFPRVTVLSQSSIFGQNPKIWCQEFNDLQTPKCSKKQLCDRTFFNPTTTLTSKSFYFNRIQHFYVKCFDSFYRLNSLKFKYLARPCISITCV